MSRRKSFGSIYKQETTIRDHAVFPLISGDNTILTFRTTDTTVVYGVSFSLTTSSGSITSPKFYVGRQTDIVGSTPFKVYPFDSHEDVSFRDIGSDTSIYDSLFVHPLTVPKGHYFSLILNTSGVTSDPVVEVDINYVVEETT
jgi:hypothetical protein